MNADDLTAKLGTVGDGRAALGVTAQWLAKGYEAAKGVSAGTGWFGTRNVADFVLGTPDNRQATRDLLDQVNGYAQKTYADLVASPDSEPIGDLRRRQVGLALTQAQQAFEMIDAQASSVVAFVAGWVEAVDAVIVGVAQGLEYTAKVVAQAAVNAANWLDTLGSKLLWYFAAGVGIFLLVRRAS